MESITVDVDLAKQVFSLCDMDKSGRVLARRELKRDSFHAWITSQHAGTVVAMEERTTAGKRGRNHLIFIARK